jgi:hypothetical protein
MNTLDQIVIRIIKEQELIIGPLAWEEARKVKGIHFADQNSKLVSIENSDGKSTIDELVSQYEHLFGRASREVCRDAAASLVVNLSPADIPSSLK